MVVWPIAVAASLACLAPFDFIGPLADLNRNSHRYRGIAPMTTAPKEESMVEYRNAHDGDVRGIFAILQEVAPEIPLSLDTPESQDVMQDIITECCACGESWVAVDADGTIVG